VALPLLRTLAGAVVETLFPRRCTGCGQAGAILCSRCAASLLRVPEPQCAICGAPLRATGAACRRCAEHPLPLDGLRSIYAYASPLKEALQRFKYVGASVAAADLAPLMARALAETGFTVDSVVGVPLHPHRERQRGFNQAAALGSALAGAAGVPYLGDAVRRVRDTPSQARQASRGDRWRNVEGAFRADPARVAGRRILVVDDVCTTGATVSACGQALRDAGAQAVWGLTLARAL